MNLLMLSPFLPYPLDQGGKIRIYNLIKHLSRSHAITLAAIVENRATADLSPLEEYCQEIILVERPARLWPDRLAFFFGTDPYNVIRYRSREMEQRLKELSQRKKIDAVQVEFSMMWQYARLFKGIPVVLDAHNVEFRNVQQIGEQQQNPFWRCMYHLEEKRLRSVELKAFRQCALCFAVSDKERAEIAGYARNDAKVATAANGVDPERFPFRLREKPGKRILFLGGMDYLPNLDAAQHFLTDIFPLVRGKEPEARVLLVGRELGKLGELLQSPGVEAHESVPEVLPWFYEADVLAVPLRQGAGTRIKVLEAMAAGLPVVTTGKGCEGIAAEDGRELLVADAKEAFAEGLLQVMQRPELGKKLAENARRLVMERYRWENTAEVIENLLGR